VVFVGERKRSGDGKPVKTAHSTWRPNFSNLYLNGGHNTLGWTMGCGFGQAIAEIVSGRQPELDLALTAIPRQNSGRLTASRPVEA
jgi:D-amino-acid dehydrogenase